MVSLPATARSTAPKATCFPSLTAAARPSFGCSHRSAPICAASPPAALAAFKVPRSSATPCLPPTATTTSIHPSIHSIHSPPSHPPPSDPVPHTEYCAALHCSGLHRTPTPPLRHHCCCSLLLPASALPCPLASVACPILHLVHPIHLIISSPSALPCLTWARQYPTEAREAAIAPPRLRSPIFSSFLSSGRNKTYSFSGS